MHKIKAMASALKRKTTDAASDILSGPTRFRQSIRKRGFDMDRAKLIRARSYDNAPDYDETGNITDAFKARALAKDVRDKYKAK